MNAFEEADAVRDARGFLTGTGDSSAFAEEGRSASALGPFPRPGAERPGAELGAANGSASICSRPGPAARTASVLISSGYYIRCHPEEWGEREARRPSSRGPERQRRRRRAGRGPTCAPSASPAGAARARAGAGCRIGGVPRPGSIHSGNGRSALFAFRHLAWVYTFLAPGVYTLKHLFNIKEAACAAVIVARNGWL